MYNPIVVILEEMYRKFKRWIVYLFYWHQLNRDLYLDMYEDQPLLKMSFDDISNDLKYLREHSASKWAYADYWASGVRMMVLAILVTLLIFGSIRYEFGL
jgi:hypothetical protein